MNLSNVLRYPYSNARIRGMKSLLLTKKDFETAYRSSTLEEFSEWLMDTSYKEDISTLEKLILEDIERKLLDNLLKVNEKVFEFSPGGAIKKFFEERLRKFEVAALKMMINSKVNGGTSNFGVHELPYQLRYSFSRMKYEFKKLMNARDVEELIAMLENTRYGYLKDYLSEYKDLGISLPLLLALDKHYFNGLWKKIDALSGEDKKIAKRLVGIEVDASNIMTALRLLGDTEKIKKFIIPHFYYLDSARIDECTKSELVTDIVNKLSSTEYGKILSNSLSDYEKTESLVPFELNLKKFLLKQNKIALTGNPFHIGTLLGYLKLKETEVENLRVMAIGIENNLPEEEIREMVIY